MRYVRMTDDTRAALEALVSGRARAALTHALDHHPLMTLARTGDWDLYIAADTLDRLLVDRLGAALDDHRRAALAMLALGFVEAQHGFALPDSIRALYPAAFQRLAAFLQSGAPLDPEAWRKDVRFVLGQTVPAGAQDVDIAFQPGRREALARARRAASAAGRLLSVSADGGAVGRLLERPAAPWLQIHTDSRHLDEFTPEGWTAAYGRIADLLALHPEFAGMAGFSWFYDPAVARISPRLSYLVDEPARNGGIFAPYASSDLDIERATATSPSRRKLFQAGQYQPRCWGLFWPRRDMLAWRLRQVGPAARAA